MSAIRELQADELCVSCNVGTFDFETTAELEPGTSIIGQSRGVQAIEFGLQMDSPGYNIYVLGESGTGRTTAIQHFIESEAATDPIPDDWVYVHNFLRPHKPVAMRLPAGVGCEFRDALREFIRRLRGEIARAFDNQGFRDAALEVQHELEARQAARIEALREQAAAQGAAIVTTGQGFQIVPARGGQPLQQQELASLSQEEREEWQAIHHSLQHELNEALHQLREMESKAQAELEALNRGVAKKVVDGAMERLKERFEAFERVRAYLEDVHEDIVDNVDVFRVDQDGDADNEAMPSNDLFRRYQVNVLVEHKHSERAPVIVEYNPSVPRLLGRVEHEARPGGAILTDFNLLRGGALHAANGGYLVLRARDLFAEPGAWEALKRSLVAGEIRPDDPATRQGSITRSLDPEAIPLEVKVVLLGPPGLYYYLHDADEDFAAIFKVMADFDQRVERNLENERHYATFVATLCQEESLSHLHRDAVGLVVEYGSRLAGTQKKLSTRFGQIADLVREAHHWARAEGRDLVRAADVEAAIDNQAYLRNRLENRARENVLDGKQLVDSEGAVVGQVNGLSVRQIGEHAFGQPTRVTARTYVGRQGVVQIDREVELAGNIHNKGLMTLVGYLGGQYAVEHPLSLSAQITFEQNYGGIDGDSASSTELYALLSSLGNVPLKQGIAVTGSVNQRGEIQAIGGVTQKVEGWFEVCQARGLTGEQGVLIPASNVSDLMLRSAVTEAVAAGSFHIWAVSSVNEGIALLSGRPAADVHAAVKRRLLELAQSMAAFQNGGWAPATPADH